MITMGEKAEIALRIVREAKEMAYDTETSGLSWKINNPVGYVVTDDTTSLYIPIRHAGGGNLLDSNVAPLVEADDPITIHAFEKELAKAFEDRTRFGYPTIGHNLKFDAHMSANAGIMLGRCLRDTELQEAMCDEHAKSFSLENSCLRRKVQPKKGQPLYDLLANMFGGAAERKQMGNFWKLPGNEPIAMEYAEGDGTSTLELYRKQLEQIAEEDMEFIVSIENELLWTVFRMERHGVRVDVDGVDEVIKGIKSNAAKIEDKLPTGFNPRSPVDMKALMEAHGHTDWPMTKPSKKFPDGQPSFNEKWLKTNPIGQSVVQLRQTTNLLNSFIVPLQERHVFNGRVHASFNQLKNDEYGTISGRFSCSDPNMQQVPKHNKELAAIFRRLFLPDEGQQFVEADYSQCEPRLFAHYSQEPSLLEGYNSDPPRDMHQVVADLMEVDRGTTAKRMNMGILTGMQIRTFSEHMNTDLENATRMFNEWFSMFPGIRNFQERAKKWYKIRGYVRTILGRRCRLDHPRFAYRATSRIIQGGNADIIKERMLAADKYLEAEGDIARLTLTVHDSLGGTFPLGSEGDRLIKGFKEILVDVQSEPYNLRVPFVLDIGAGATWAEATFGAA